MVGKITPESVSALFFVVLVYQALVLSLVLMAFAKWKKQKPVTLLSVLFLLTAMVFTGFFAQPLGWYMITRFLILLLPGALFCLVPLAYLYFRFEKHPLEQFSFHDMVHFIPALVAIFINLFLAALGSEKNYFSYIPAIGQGLVKVARLPAFIMHPVQVFFLLQLAIYIGLGFKNKHIVVFRERNQLSPISYNMHKWTLGCQVGFAFFFLIFNVLVLGNMIYPDVNHLSATLPYSLAMILITLTLGICGFKHEALKQQSSLPASQLPEVEPTPIAIGTPKAMQASPTNGNNGSPCYPNLSPAVRQRIEHGLKMLEDEGFFFQTDITLEMVAKKIDTNVRYLSQWVNENTGDSFISYINVLRIEESKKRLITNLNGKYSIEGVGKSLGFKSKSTFNTAFRKYTGKTPTEYIESVRG